ncbi:anti-sigma factor [Bacteroidia bacterium]|nr:anti-sigma factor [Bacteroidia bacterium]
MQKDYRNYSTVNFLHDNYFVEWRLSPTGEIDLFWKKFIEEHPEKKEQIDHAIEIFSSVKLNNYFFTPEEKEAVLKNLKDSIRKKKKTKKLQYIIQTAAAIALLLICSYFFIPDIRSRGEQSSIIKTDTTKHNKDIQLILANNEILVFSDDATIQYDNGNVTVSCGNRKLTSIKIDAKQTLNKLIVPKGKRSSLVLSDGSKIWINSGTTLEYPAEFDKKKREININGEIYIEVARNEEQPFFVNTPFFSVEVLGTHFNISAYGEDSNQSVVLVEGSVKVKTQAKKTAILQPDQMLTMSSDVFQTKQVNVYDYISWKDGLLQFHSEPLNRILNRLSRYYDVKIECESEIQNMRCTGKLVLFDDFKNVLKIISNTIPVQYEQSEDQIIFTKIKK